MINPNVVTPRLAMLVTLVNIPLFSLSAAHAQTNINLSSGLTYINQQNLQSNPVATTDGTLTSRRTGWQLGIGGSWQQLDDGGGYAVDAQASADQGLDGANTIHSATLDASWMHPLSSRWLSRINVNVGNYQDDDQPAYSNQATGVGLTLGWFGSHNAGLDLTVHGQQEEYKDNPDQAYDANRYNLSSRYYFAHTRHSAYWSVAIEIGRFEVSSLPGYSYDSQRLTLAYNAWRWQKLSANIQLQWRHNRFDRVRNRRPSTPAIGGGMLLANPPSPQTTAQSDSYLTATLNLSYLLSEQWRLRADLNSGQYRSNVAEDRPLLGAYLGLSVHY